MERGLSGLVKLALTAAAAGVILVAPHAQEGPDPARSWQAAWEARHSRDAERREVERIRREYERRRAVAHARMRSQPDIVYPSSAPADVICPVASSPEARREFELRSRQRREAAFRRATGLPLQTGYSVHPVPKRSGNNVTGVGSLAMAASPHLASTAVAAASAALTSESGHMVPLFPSASDDLGRQGFARVINHSDEAGEATVEAFDDEGTSYGALTLSIDAGETVHFNSADLENGNAGKGLSGSTGPGQGDWRLDLASGLDIEVLSYIRTADGFLTAMHDTAPAAEGRHQVAVFNPGSNLNQVSLLRLVNRGDAEATATITAVDDKGASPGGGATVAIPSGASRTYTAAQLEAGGAAGLEGSIGDGAGKWRLVVESEQDIVAMSLLSSPTGHLTNLSTAPDNEADGTHSVPLFPPASDANGRQGFVRVVNRSDEAGEVAIVAYDDTETEYDALTLAIGPNGAVHFNSDDLELGNAGKGLTGSTGAGTGDWRLEFTSELGIRVLSYIRTDDGFLTAMHDVVPRSAKRHRVAVFNPGSNANQQSLLRLVNAGDGDAEVTIAGSDGNGESPGSDVVVTVPAGSSTTVAAQDLEAGSPDFEGALGDGAGKWSLTVRADRVIAAMSLLSSPTGHLTNLSTAPQRGAGPVETAEEAFEALISPIVQSKCVNCHVEGGSSGHTPLVFVREADADHLAKNLEVFEDYLADVEDGANRILNKIQGALAHGGGVQVAAGTDEYAGFDRFMELLGADVERPDVTVDNLFDGVILESPGRTLRRAAIIFAGRVPTGDEYASIEGGSDDDLRRGIRDLMNCPEDEPRWRCGFHEFLIRAGNDRLLTDRLLPPQHSIENDGFFVEFDNEFYRRYKVARETGDRAYAYQWEHAVQYGAGRAPLELIAYVAKNDLSYTEVLTADYIMANPWAAEVYGATTEFDDRNDVHEFKPSEIVSYYRVGGGHRTEFTPGVGLRVVDPGPLRTRWPHAGILNTKVFLKRYPTTATNRNRARSRWTYYHFLGFDIEKSESRTTDPVALMDTNNPTMRNPACTVCHSVMDPVAGAFQNYGDVGFYRDQWGGLDSLDGQYKDGTANARGVEARSWAEAEREPVSWTVGFVAGKTTLGVTYTNDFYDEETGHEGRVYLDQLSVVDDRGDQVARFEFEDLGPPYNEPDGHYCGGVRHNPDTGEEDHIDLHNGGPDCMFLVDLDLPADGSYGVKIAGWAERHELFGQDRMARIAVTENPYRTGDTWYRDMREPGFGGALVPDRDNSLRWLAERIAEDQRFAEATVKFWWPAIMGSEVAEPPTDESDADFEGLLLASNAQSAEVRRLARGFRGGFGGGFPSNLKDLLVELVLSRWFRADSMADDAAVRTLALREAGARRLLTPEELARKTAALTGFQWGRWHRPTSPPHEQWLNRLTDGKQYRLLYGGIDSDGVTERARDLTSVMAGVATSHAVESSCPVVLRELYLLPDADRRLFGGMDTVVSPVWEDARQAFATPEDWGSVTLEARLTAGSKVVRLTVENGNALVDDLVVRDSQGDVIASFEYEGLPETDCGQPWPDIEPGFFAFWCGSVDATVQIPTAGDYDVEVKVLGEPRGDVSVELTIAVESADTSESKGASAINAKLAELHWHLLGVDVGADSPDVQAVYGLFVDVWERKRTTDDDWFFDAVCPFDSDLRFFEGILDDAVTWQESDAGPFREYDHDRVWRFLNEDIRPRDPDGVARTWVVVLAAMLMDYRYLYL